MTPPQEPLEYPQEEVEPSEASFQVPASSSLSTLVVPTAVGLAGVLLASIGLFMHFGKTQDVSSKDTHLLEISNRIERVSQEVASLQTRFQQIDDQNREEHIGLKNSVQRELNKLAQEIARDRREIDRIARSVASSVREWNEGNAAASSAAEAVTQAQPEEEPQAAALQAVPSRETAAPKPPQKSYTVKAGDSLWRIAQNHKVSVAELEKANPGVKSNNLKVGQKITIPSPVISE